MLRQKLYKLKQEQGVESEPLFPILKKDPSSPSDRYVRACFFLMQATLLASSDVFGP